MVIETTVLIALLVLVLAVFLLAVIVYSLIKKSKKKQEPDYYTLFVMGIIWFITGILLNNPALWALGLIFFAVGLSNCKKWNKNRKEWKQLDKKERLLLVTILIVLAIVFFGEVILFLLANGGNFF